MSEWKCFCCVWCVSNWTYFYSLWLYNYGAEKLDVSINFVRNKTAKIVWNILIGDVSTNTYVIFKIWIIYIIIRDVPINRNRQESAILLELASVKYDRYLLILQTYYPCQFLSYQIVSCLYFLPVIHNFLSSLQKHHLSNWKMKLSRWVSHDRQALFSVCLIS